MAVDDRLRAARSCRTSTGCTAGGRTGPPRTRAARRGEEVGPGEPRREPGPRSGVEVRRATTVASSDGSAARISATSVRAVDRLVAVAVAVDGEQDARLDLGEPIDHGAHPELRRARRPDRTEAGGREQRDDRLGDVRAGRRRPDRRGGRRGAAGRPDSARRRRAARPRSASTGAARLRAPDDDDVVVAPAGQAQGVLRVVEVARRGTRSRPASSDRPDRRSGGSCVDDLEVVPHRSPEGARLSRRTSARASVVGLEPEAARRVEPGQVAAHPRALADVGGWRPEDVGSGRRALARSCSHPGTVSQRGDPPRCARIAATASAWSRVRHGDRGTGRVAAAFLAEVGAGVAQVHHAGRERSVGPPRPGRQRRLRSG